MRGDEMKKGSALLIVLGMVAFMVVSAVGFAVFMRHNRIPSSFLRRSTAARELARAALACAMSDIESAIEDNPYPGLGNNGEGQNRWIGRGRVFAPHDVSEDSTVSTLTLEGLAYLPPPMINDVRYYSRRTSTAQWKRLDYDSGRYAFCAVNVSDFFDLSRVSADRPRGSGDQNLVSLAYLFEDGGHRNWGEIDPIDFRDKLNEIISEKSLVSLADYNLALKSHGCDLASPFVEYIEQNGANGFYKDVRTTDKTNPDYLKYAIQRFVVDGHSELDCEEWCRGAIKNGGNGARLEDKKDYLDITKDDEHQPFPQLIDKDSLKLTEVMDAGGGADFWDWAYKPGSGRPAIRTCESVALCDYLDKDDIPLSVALPTVERAPMIVAVEIDADSNFKVGIAEDDPVPGGTPEKVEGATIYRKTVTFYPKFEGDISVNAGTVFPFKYRKELNANRSFKGEVIGHFYLLEKGKVWQANDQSCGCRARLDGPIGAMQAKKEGVGFSNGVFTFVSSSKDVKIPSTITDEKDAVSDGDLALHEMKIRFDDYNGDKLKDNFLVRYHLKKVVKEDESVEPDWQIDEEKAPEFGFNYVDVVNGTAPAKITKDVEYVWGLSLAVRLWETRKNKKVDMVPAHLIDDDDSSNQKADGIKNLMGLQRPVLRFDDRNGNMVVKINTSKEGYDELHGKSADGMSPLTFEPKAYMTDDPRYNYAAENWYPATPAAGDLGVAWLDSVSCGDVPDKDNDIFMSVSNQGYLQDVGELAFLPRVAGLTGNQDLQPVQNAATGVIPTGRDAVANRNQMWRTYGCFGDLGDDEVDNLRLVSPVKGFRVNPFTNDEMVKLAPFLNTPYDWWAAGTNLSDSVKQNMIDRNGKTSTPENALRYSFGERGVEAKVEFQYMEKLAEKISAELRRGGSDWYNTWRNMKWLDERETSICDVDIHRTLHDVDRKFLYSYWRKCYANAQQLFIVFFRAEPVVLGGGSGDGNTPAQLGARGVAVVWRDPIDAKGAAAAAPHRMRVLFYRQFD